MSAHWPIVYFGAIAVAAISISAWATWVLLQQSEVPRTQRRWQLVLIWVVPVFGALVVIELYRASRKRRSTFVTADEINPMLNQALQPLAREATRVAEGFIEQEVYDAVLDHFADSSGHGGSGDGGSH